METGQYLRCDRDGCDHVESIPKLQAEMIGKPCPKCGDNLLTKEDFAHWEKVVEPQLAALRLIEAAAIEAGVISPDDPKIKFSLNHHNGVSNLNVTIPEEAQ